MLNQVASKDKKKKDKKRKHARGGDTPAHEERSEEDKVKNHVRIDFDWMVSSISLKRANAFNKKEKSAYVLKYLDFFFP